jgi:hypothetical protein
MLSIASMSPMMASAYLSAPAMMPRMAARSSAVKMAFVDSL